MSYENFPSNKTLNIRQLSRLDRIDAEQWNALTGKSNPFLSHEYLNGLEIHGCFEGHGWTPFHLAVYDGEELLGAMPNYLKSNSYGEFVFDWAWAEAYERAGGRYYPKMVSTIPFAPVCGQRLLIKKSRHAPEAIKALLIDGALELAKQNGLSSFHCLFPAEDDKEYLSQKDLLSRKGFQYHWHNHEYRNFDHFLSTLTSKKRKQIKRERRQVRENNIEIEVLRGDQISQEHWRIFYDFYCSTFLRRWGAPRLTYDFFLSLSETMPDQTLLFLARVNQSYVAGAFAMCNDDTLYGRHWGCSSQYPNLHFELCYYQTIEYCIQHGLKTLDAGVQGEHKLSRGFEPVTTWSCHWIQHEGFRSAIKDFLQQETPGIDAYMNELGNHLPYKKDLK